MTPRLRLYLQQAALEEGTSPQEIMSPIRYRNVCRARRSVAIRLSDDGFNNSEIARWLKLHPSSVHYYTQGGGR